MLGVPNEPIVFVRSERIPPAKIDAIFRETGKEAPLFRAVLQILEETRDEAIESEAQDAWNPTAMAKHSGGAQYLRAVRDELIRRQMGRGKTPNAQGPTSNG
jgi:hypothetical protein